MRPFSFGHRWLKRGSTYSGPWAQNPWIKSASGDLQRRKDLDCTAAATIMLETAAHRPGDAIMQRRQQKSAIGTWEDEGGSVGPRTLRC